MIALVVLHAGLSIFKNWFPFNKALCPSICTCARLYIVSQGFGTSAAKGAHVGLRYPTMQRETINKLIFTVP